MEAVPMVSVYVDTCVWWNWFKLTNGLMGGAPDTQTARDVADFQTVFDRVSGHQNATFLHSELVRLELDSALLPHFDRDVAPYSRKVLIPCTRSDGRYRLDGSIMPGGRYGGSLRPLLNLSGYKHDDRLQEAAEALRPGQPLYEERARLREFDIEHMEAALDADAALFVTTDRKTIIRPFRAAQGQFAGNPVISRALAMVVTPEEAITRMASLLPS